MKKIKTYLIFFLITAFLFFWAEYSTAQINVSDGLNMPGAWDNWDNPPTNLVFAGEAETSGGKVKLMTELSSVYQTKFHVAASGGNVTGGTYEFLFTSTSYGDPWGNKWTDVNVTVNTLQTYTYHNDGGGSNNSVTLSNDKWYTMNFENIGYEDTRAIFMQISSEPAEITSVSQNPMMPTSSDDVEITVELNHEKATDEYFYIRYTTDNWTSSNLLSVNFTGINGTGTIGAEIDETEIEYYIFSTVFNMPSQDFDLITVNYDKNGGDYYSYTVGEELTCEGQTGVLTTDPAFPLQEGPVTITFDATLGNGGLAGYEGDVYAHTGVITSESSGNNDWLYVVTEWGENTPETKFTNIGIDLYELSTANIREYYDVPEGEEIYKIAMVIRSGEPIIPEEPDNFYVARSADGSDIYIDVYDEGLHVKLLSPNKKDPLVPLNSLIPVCVTAMDATTISVLIDDILVHQDNALETMYALNTGDYDVGMHEIIADADDGSSHAYDTTFFFIRGDVVIEDLPSGVHKGINYINDNTVTLVLHDPPAAKDFAFVIGDFNNWTASDEGYMKRTPDGQYYWTTITGLTPGVEYAYQYYIDGELKLTDPYCDKVLDPWNDRYIPETTYPNLKDYPWDQTIGIVGVLETDQDEFSWVINDFTPVALNETQSNLIIYELLIRDFVESRDIKGVIDTLDYLQNLGVNAVELMPVNEFDGNDSWGYAPNFYFALDKAYGTKDDYKTFIDECHQRGIAVIFDVVYNHMYGGSSFVQMYWDDENEMPAVNNPWFNQEATHPYSIGYDFDHESTYTRNLIKDNLTYWMTEYKIDGFRFDLSKGFTQTYSGDVGAWSQYDQSRIDIITDYYNHVKSVNSDAYFILEHFANNDEEVVLANTGCLLWGVHNEQFNQCTMGWDINHDFSWATYSERGFTYPNLIPFMESHDEERLMFRNLAYGNGFSGDTTVSLQRIEAIIPFYMAIPGPKMIWQFGETGYDESIELCSDGTYSDDCRTSAKPIHCEYMQDQRRQKLYWTYAGMAKLKTENEAFRNGTFGQDQSGLGKKMWISHASLNVSITGNFAASSFNMTPNFQHTGTWYNYFTGEEINVTDAGGHSIYYEPGDFYVFTDTDLGKPYANLTFNVKNKNNENLNDALVEIHNYSSNYTAGSGNAGFIFGTDIELTYTVSKTGYYPQSATVQMPNQDHTIYIILGESNIETVSSEEIFIYPNPAKDKLYFKIEDINNICIFDISGKLIKKVQTKSGQNSINISEIKNGLYILRFDNGEELIYKKVIIKNN